MSRARKRHTKFNFSWKIMLWTLAFTIFIGSAFFLDRQFSAINYFPIKNVKVFGARNVDRDEVKVILSPLVSKNFFGVDVENIKDRLLQIPWVSQVSVRRIWPGDVIINIVEKKPLARWNDESLLSTTGEIFTPDSKTFPKELPSLVGPEGQQISVMQYYLKTAQLLTVLNVKITRVELTPGLSWNLMLNNGMKLHVGYKDSLTHLSHFVKVYPKIVGDRAADVDYVDLRYSNGLAVRWKSIT